MRIDILLRSKYDPTFPKFERLVLTIKDRFKGEVKIDGSEIDDVTKESIILKNGTEIPAHRLIDIKFKKRK